MTNDEGSRCRAVVVPAFRCAGGVCAMQPSPRSRRLLCDAPARRLNVQMGYMLRYNPAFELCRKLIREGALGEYNAGRQTLTFPKGRDATTATSWISRK